MKKALVLFGLLAIVGCTQYSVRLHDTDDKPISKDYQELKREIAEAIKRYEKKSGFEVDHVSYCPGGVLSGRGGDYFSMELK